MESITYEDKGWMLSVLCSAFLIFQAAAAVDVTVEAGNDVTLVCGLGEDYPEWFDEEGVALTENNATLSPDMEYVNKQDIRIINVTTSQAGNYTCRGANVDAKTVTLIVNSFDYKVSFSDVYRKHIIDAPFIPIIADKNLVVTCTVKNAFPVPQVTLGFLPPYTRVISDVSTVVTENEADKTFTVVASGTVIWSEDVDNEFIFCNATSGNRYKDANEQIKVVYPPLLLSYTGLDEFEAGDNSGRIACQTDKTYPEVEFKWVVNGSSSQLPPGFSPPEPTKCTSVQGTGDYLRSTLYNCETQLNFTNLPKEYYGMEIYCANIYLGEQETDPRVWKLSFMFPPTTATILESDDPIRAKEGDTITLSCMADSAYRGKSRNDSGVSFEWVVHRTLPDPSAMKQISKVEEPGEYGGFTTTATVQIPMSRELDGAKVYCRARNDYQRPLTSYVEDSRQLKIAYGPAIIQPYRNEFRTYIDVPVQIPCMVDSDPVSTITWSKILENGTATSIQGHNNAAQFGNLLVLRLDPEQSYSYAGKYSCSADNGIGQAASKEIQVIVSEKPYDPNFGLLREDAESFTLEINMTPADGVLSYVYVQYRYIGEERDTANAIWSEVEQRFPDADYGSATDKAHTITVTGLQPGIHYDIRLKMVDSEGNVYYSTNTLAFQTKENSGKGLKTYSQYRDVILICVLVTFGGMLIILIVAVVCVKRGACGKRDKMELVAMS